MKDFFDEFFSRKTKGLLFIDIVDHEFSFFEDVYDDDEKFKYSRTREYQYDAIDKEKFLSEIAPKLFLYAMGETYMAFAVK